jgi:hypothetical protein
MKIKATYSPEDNKIRLYPSERLEQTAYEKVSKAGFKWAPAQKLFVAPKWTPQREDLALELAGEILPEEMSLEERSVNRSERFASTSERKAFKAEQSETYVERLTDIKDTFHGNARRAQKLESKINKAQDSVINLWQQAVYWEARAEASLEWVERKLSPQMRFSRIKTLETELRAFERQIAEANANTELWNTVTTVEEARTLANIDRIVPRLWHDLNEQKIGWESAKSLALSQLGKHKQHYQRWADQIKMRIIYEKCFLVGFKTPEQQNATIKIQLQKGGAIRWKAAPQLDEVVRINQNTVSIRQEDCYGRTYTRKLRFQDIKEVYSPEQFSQWKAGLLNVPA